MFLLWVMGQLLLVGARKLLGRLQELCIGFSDVAGQGNDSISICRSECIYCSLLILFWSVCMQ